MRGFTRWGEGAMLQRAEHRLLLGVFVAILLAIPGSAQVPPMLPVDGDGTVHVPALNVPVSEFLSPEGKAYLADHLNRVRRLDQLKQVDGIPVLLAGYLERQRTLFPADKADTTVGGVHAFVYTPKTIAPNNAKRVLINLHGGGFSGCWLACGELESRPVAALGGIKVVSLDYRESPTYEHPAASEDVAAAYRELLKTYRPENIGIYGCSAGGMLTGMSVAWFQRHSLPRPGAVGVLCSGLTAADGFGGDSKFTAMAAGEGRLSFVPPAPAPGAKTLTMAYLAHADVNDPLVAPAVSMEVLAKFPPTLMVTTTRGFDMSSAVYAHSRLVKAGVEADLHVWDGMFHGFFYNPDVPESRECYDVIVKFFDRHLGK
jgi:acetyl esterase/lipase